MSSQINKIAVLGLGYVGLPLAVEFARKYNTIGFDIDVDRIENLKNNHDKTQEISSELLNSVIVNGNVKSSGLFLTSDIDDLANCNIYIITVPTPVDKYHRPDLTPMINATEAVAALLKPEDIVIYESTVYPGMTEEEMVPILERKSGLKFNVDFYCGYSPERINPGDKINTLTNIIKITSGSTPEVAIIIDDLYNSIITAGTHKAPSIKVAEAAKVIENSQRDINIAFVNELSKIFNLLGIDTKEVLEAASTKWNFLKFHPGLVGGHCIGVDPYYLAQKALQSGYHPEIILSGRRLNDSMGKYVASEVIKLMLKKNLRVLNSKVLILGFSFKENCPDYRNTKIVDIYHELKSFDIEVDVYDPWVNSADVRKEYGLQILDTIPNYLYSAVILAVPHKEFAELDIVSLSPDALIIDVKGMLPKEIIDFRL